jgi:hypothetical protein
MGIALPRILLIDDDPRVADSLDDLMNQHDFQIVYYQHLESGLSELQNNYDKYIGIILDAKGQINEGARQDDESHITFAVTELAKLEHSGIKVPWIIYTAHFDKYSIDFRHLKERVYKKNRDEEKLIKYFIGLRGNSISYKIRNKYFSICEILDRGLLDEKTKHQLIRLLSCVEENRIHDFSFNDLRLVLEEVLVILHKVGVLPNAFMKGPRPILELSYRYLSGLRVDFKESQSNVTNSFPSNTSPIFPDHISTIFDAVKNISSMRSHTYSDTFTINTNKFAAFGLLEILTWLDNYLNQNNLINI